MFFIVIFTFLGLLTGYILAKKYRKRYEMLKKTKNFFEFYKLKISYSQTKISEVVKEFYKNSKYNTASELMEFFSSKNENKKLEISDAKFLKEREYKELIDDFSCLGRLGKEQEIENVSNIIVSLKDKENDACSDYKKYANLYLKLFTLLGLTIGILLL